MAEEYNTAYDEEEKNTPAWYVVRVHTGFEQPVKFGIEQAVQALHLEEKIFEVIIPTEKQVRIKGGRRVEKEERIYPGYILVNMVIDDQTWYAINNIEHVSGFLGSRSHAESLSQDEVDLIKERMHGSAVQHQMDYKIGDSVKITEGPFADLDGKIGEIDANKGQITVLIPMFGRETPIKLDIFQVRSV